MKLNALQLDVITETVNIGVGRASASLSQLLDTRIELSVPIVRVVENSALEQAFEARSSVSVVQGFTGKVAGKAMLSFSQASGETLARVLGGFEQFEDVSTIELSGILTEVGNIVLNGILGSMSNMIQENLVYDVPDFFIHRQLRDLVTTVSRTSQKPAVLIADADFEVTSRQIRGTVLITFEIGALDSLIDNLLNAMA